MTRKARSGRGQAAKPVAADDDLAKTREAPTALPRLSLLAAAEAEIEEKGFVRATVEDIAARAGVSTDVFYAHFATKEALLRPLSERRVEQLLYVTDEATRSGMWETATPQEILEVATRSAVEAIFERAGLMRAILSHGAKDPTLIATLHTTGTHLARRVAKLTAQSTLGDPLDERTVAFCLLIAVSLAQHAVLVGADSTGEAFTREEVTGEAVRAVTAYLGAVMAARKSTSGRNNAPGTRV